MIHWYVNRLDPLTLWANWVLATNDGSMWPAFYFLSMTSNPSEYYVFQETLRLPESKPIRKTRFKDPRVVLDSYSLDSLVYNSSTKQ